MRKLKEFFIWIVPLMSYSWLCKHSVALGANSGSVTSDSGSVTSNSGSVSVLADSPWSGTSPSTSRRTDLTWLWWFLGHWYFSLLCDYYTTILNSRVGNHDKLFTWSQLSLSALLLYWLADQSEASEASHKNCAVLIGVDWMCVTDWVTSATTRTS